MTLGDEPLILLLRFVDELKKGKGGWITINKLVAEQYLTDKTNLQAIDRVRNPFKGYLLNRKKTNAHLDFIENRRPNKYRLSVHPSLVSYDREQLL